MASNLRRVNIEGNRLVKTLVKLSSTESQPVSILLVDYPDDGWRRTTLATWSIPLDLELVHRAGTVLNLPVMRVHHPSSLVQKLSS